ncbi:recombinase family protein [Bremerella sp. JC817]|uniref:recombinase family protein n=1 Tax=Bremerella sp. JC817 TaxID=3231756 RepID=UPI00345B09E8
MIQKKTKPAVGYVRMSTDQQQDSPARQRKDIENLADRLGYRIVRWYQDHGLTGVESSKRKDFQKLMADAKNGSFDAVLLSEQSRMSREDVFDAMVHWKQLRDSGVRIITCQRGELDFSNLGGVITAIVDQYGAREESMRLADRVISGKRLAISRGQKQGGPPFGYDRRILDEAGKEVRRVGTIEKFRLPAQWSSQLVPTTDEKAVEAIQQMFHEAANGTGCGAIARQLNRDGFRTMYGKRFNSTSVRRIITNPVYAGDIVSGKRRRGRFRSFFDDGAAICEGAHEGLVSREVFNQTQRMLAQNSKPAISSTPGKYLLTSLVFLPDGRRLQGATMSHTGGTCVRRYYALPGHAFEESPEESDRPSFRAEIIEAGVLAKLKAFLADRRTRSAIKLELSRRSKRVAKSFSQIESKLDAIRAKIERGTENLALADPANIPGITKLLSQWREEEQSLKEKLARVGGVHNPSPETLQVLENLDQLLNNIEAADREKLSSALRSTIKRITLRRERRVESYYRVTMWDGVIELCDGLGIDTVIPLTDDDIPTSGQWREVAHFIRQRGDVVFFKEVCQHLGTKGSCVSRYLAQAVLSGKVHNLGHQKGWIAV